jgi:ribosomal protein S18 acetylase RimI-like enzyme
MYKALGEPDPELAELRASSPTRGNLPPGCQFRLWDDAYFEPTAELIVDAYASHFDSQLNDQYAGLPGALRFLQNIVVFPGCGVFLSDASLLAIETGTGQLLGVVLLSRVGPRIGHVTQICLRPAWQGLGIGRTLLQAALDRLRGKDFRAVSLTVTAANHNAVHLYEQLGFNVIKRFSAYARTCPLPRA